MIKLTQPYIPEEAIVEVVKVLRSGNLVQGEYVKNFEEQVFKYLNIKHAIAVSSGTAALHLSLIALNIKPGDEVIVPAFTYPATANVVEIIGAKPVFVDIGLDDLCIKPSLIEKAITPKTKAIIPVHEFGQSAKMDDIISLAEKYGLKIIEDAACALGTEFNNQKVGTIGDIGCFSLHPRKAITTGEGGFVATNNDSIADKIRSLRNHGIKVRDNGMYDFIYAGFNYRMTDFQAALGIQQLQLLDKIISKRIQLADYYNENLSEISWIRIPRKITARRMVYQTYHALVSDFVNRDMLITYLKTNNIEANIGAYALCSLTYYKQKYGLSDSIFPNAQFAFEKGLALPMSYSLESDTINYIVEILKKFKV